MHQGQGMMKRSHRAKDLIQKIYWEHGGWRSKRPPLNGDKKETETERQRVGLKWWGHFKGHTVVATLEMCCSWQLEMTGLLALSF